MIAEDSSLFHEIGHALREHGWWAGAVLSPALADALLDEARQLHGQGAFHTAAIGAGHSKMVDSQVRGDETCWVESATPVQAAFAQAMQGLQNVFERHFPIALEPFAGHYSYYPIGTYYQKHWDNARHRNSRVFSVVNYLNPDWHPGDGGELVLYRGDDTSQEVARIEPRMGITAVFFSTDFPHEVTATRRSRYSLTGWLHRQERPFS